MGRRGFLGLCFFLKLGGDGGAYVCGLMGDASLMLIIVRILFVII